MLTSAFAVSADAAGSVIRREDLAEHSVGICGSFTGWGQQRDIPMSDNGNGVYEATVEISEVTEDIISELESDAIPTGKYGIQFKIRCDNSWDNSWGDYEIDYERFFNSQTNMLIPDSDITIGKPLIFKVIFDTTKAHPDDEYQDPDDPITWYVSCEVIDLGFHYEENKDGTITLLGFKSADAANYYRNQSGVFVFPDTVDGKTVTKIGFPANPDEVDSASEEWAEAYNTSFQVIWDREIQLPSTIKEIGDNAFFSPKFVDDKLPEGLERIGNYSMTHIGHNEHTSLIMPSTLKYIGEGAFYESKIQELVLNDGLEYIGAEAFRLYGTTPDRITIPKSVKYIGWDAFITWSIDNSKDIWVEGLQGSTVFDIYGGYVEQYMKTYTPYYDDKIKAGYNYTVIGQVDETPSQTESVNGLKVSGAIPDGAEFKAVATTTKWLEDPLFCYEISLNKDSAEVQPGGYITISIPCEYSNGYVVYINEETGETENLNSIYVDGYYVFVTDHLSKYGITFDSDPVKYDGTKKDDTKTDDNKTDDTKTDNTKTDDNTRTGTNTNNQQNPNNNNNTDNQSKSDNPTPQTGDSPFTALSLALTASAAALAAVMLGRKKKTN